jgi:potassium inwardly-rectifying channel subfamily J
MYKIIFSGLWLIFGLFYWAIAWQHNDIEFMLNSDNFPDHVVCVDQVFDFTTAFLFALEGQTTIGYGSRSTTEQCSIAIILQFIQYLSAIALDSLVVTIVFTKVS